MKITKIKGEGGKEVAIYEPESEEDIKILQRMEAADLASSKASFGDWKFDKKNFKPSRK